LRTEWSGQSNPTAVAVLELAQGGRVVRPVQQAVAVEDEQ
jgi:hypothetical protein